MSRSLRIALCLAQALVVLLSGVSLIAMLILSTSQEAMAALCLATARRALASGALLSMALFAAQQALPPAPCHCEKGVMVTSTGIPRSLWGALALQGLLCCAVAWPLAPYISSSAYIKVQAIALALYLRALVA